MTTKQKPKPQAGDTKQSQRFVETAKEVEVDETGKLFEKVMQQITNTKTERVKK